MRISDTNLFSRIFSVLAIILALASEHENSLALFVQAPPRLPTCLIGIVIILGGESFNRENGRVEISKSGNISNGGELIRIKLRALKRPTQNPAAARSH